MLALLNIYYCLQQCCHFYLSSGWLLNHLIRLFVFFWTGNVCFEWNVVDFDKVFYISLINCVVYKKNVKVLRYPTNEMYTKYENDAEPEI